MRLIALRCVALRCVALRLSPVSFGDKKSRVASHPVLLSVSQADYWAFTGRA
jgi:hypothetical protein